MLKIEEALKHVDETKALIIESDVISKLGKLFAEQFPNQKAIIVSDQYMYDLIGKKIGSLLDESQIDQYEPFVFKDPVLLANYENVDRIYNHLKENNAIPIAVGSGIINDLTKLASHNSNRRYMCVATAASVDGYTAYGASITLDGSKQTFSCPAPLVCLADVDILKNAPLQMAAAGYADTIAKIPAGADWILADGLGVEPINEIAWDIVQGGLHEAVLNPEGIPKREAKAFRVLTERLMLSGLAMQQARTTRTASGAEHQFSHLWDMEGHSHNDRAVPHGFQVGIGTLAVTAFYEQLFNIDMNDLDIDECCRVWPTLEYFTQNAKEMFKDTEFPLIGVEEMKAKYISKEELREQLVLLKAVWAKLKNRLSKQIIPFEEVKRCLKVVGAPTEPEEIGISREYLRESFDRGLYIRRRFTVLDIAIRANLTDKLLDGIFGPDGVWPIKD